MADTLSLTLLAPERNVLQNVDVNVISLTGSEGQIQILPAHITMIGSIETGGFRCQKPDGTEIVGVISSGFFEVISDNKVIITAETVELQNEIDVARAMKAQNKAEEMLKTAKLSESEFRKFHLKLLRSLVRQQFGIKN